MLLLHEILSLPLTTQFESLRSVIIKHTSKIDKLRDKVGKLLVNHSRFSCELQDWKQDLQSHTNDVIDEVQIQDHEFCDENTDWIPINYKPPKCHRLSFGRKKPVHQVCSLHKSWQIHECNKFGKQEHELKKELQDLSSKARFFTKEHERLTKKLSLIQVRGDFPDLIASVQRELSANITENAWNEKEINRVQQQLNALQCKPHVSHIERAFIALATDHLLANISTSQINSAESRDLEEQAKIVTEQIEIPTLPQETVEPNTITMEETLLPRSPLPNVNTMTDISIQNELLEDQRRHDRASAQLHDELRQAQHDITLIITQLHQECQFHDEARAEFELERSRFLQHHEQLQRTIDATLHRQENLEEALDSLQENQLESSLSAPSITSPMKKLLETYHELDEDSKKALLTSAITSNNTDLQWAILQLRDSKKNNNNSSAQA